MNISNALSRTASAVAIGAAVAAAPATAQTYDLLPMLDLVRNEGAPPSGQLIVGGYVRVWVERVQGQRPAEGPAPDSSRHTPRDYHDERRHPVLRWLIGRNRSHVLQARLVISRSSLVAQSVTLASASHDSNGRDGESWRSELSERRFLTPYFRVDQGTTAAVEVTLSSSRETDSAVARNVLSLVQTGAGLVAPGGSLVTSLNADRFNQSANFIDTAVSQLFREKLAEVSQSDFPADYWLTRPPGQRESGPGLESGSAIASIRARFPMRGHVWTGPGHRDIGEWRVYVTPPIVSIYATTPLNGPANQDDEGTATCANASEALAGSDLQACIAFRGITPARVLGLTITENVTLGQALRGDAGIAAAIQRFSPAAAESEGSTAAAREVCNLVAEKAYSLGLNAYDAAAAVWAFSWSSGIDPKLGMAIGTVDCSAGLLADRLRLVMPASATQSPERQPAPPARPGGAKG